MLNYRMESWNLIKDASLGDTGHGRGYRAERPEWGARVGSSAKAARQRGAEWGPQHQTRCRRAAPAARATRSSCSTWPPSRPPQTKRQARCSMAAILHRRDVKTSRTWARDSQRVGCSTSSSPHPEHPNPHAMRAPAAARQSWAPSPAAGGADAVGGVGVGAGAYWPPACVPTRSSRDAEGSAQWAGAWSGLALARLGARPPRARPSTRWSECDGERASGQSRCWWRGTPSAECRMRNVRAPTQRVSYSSRRSHLCSKSVMARAKLIGGGSPGSEH